MPFHDMSIGSGAESSVLHPLVALAALLVIALIFTLPRHKLIAPVLCAILLIPNGQQLYVAGIHLFVSRLIILAGCLRLFQLRPWLPHSRRGAIDHLLLAWAGFKVLGSLIFYASLAAISVQIGFIWSSVGGYFLLRGLIQDDQDSRRAIKCLSVIAAVCAVAMVIEKLTLVNIFGLLGGVRFAPDIREGTIRANGPFQHAILAGCFGGTLLPLFYLLFKHWKARFFGALGLASASLIVVCSGSSSPLLAYVAGLVSIFLWPMHRKMRLVRWGFVLLLVALQCVMKADVWWLIARVDLVGGSSGYHRAALIDTCIRHFWDWWLIGTDEMANWGWDMWDLSNQFVAEAETGGLAVIVCFIALLSKAFGNIGRAIKNIPHDRRRQRSLWCLGAAVTAHATAFFGVSYWDQMHFVWLTMLALVVANAPVGRKKSHPPQTLPSPAAPEPTLVCI